SWTVVNAGVIVDTTTGDGVKLAGIGTLTNQSGGYIAGYNGAYVNTGTVNNAGTMAGVFNGAEVIFGAVNNQSDGTLSGFFGTYVYNGTIINAGTIASTNGTAGIAAITGGFRGTVIDDPGAVFIGHVEGGTETSGISLLTLGSGSTEGTLTGYGTQFTNFRTLEIASGATWDIAGTTTIAGTLINDGTIIETAADTLDVTGTLEGTGTIMFDPTTGIFDGPVGAGQVIDFSGAGSTIVLGDPTQFAGTLSGFAAGDVLTLPSLAVSAISSETFGNGTLTLTGSFGVIDLAFANSPALTTGTLTPVDNGNGGISFDAPCFAAGTAIATARGAVAVEALRIGDLARLAGGGFAPIVWLGRRTTHPARHPRPEAVNPVMILAGALADGVPSRDLMLSPDHALWLDGVLIPAKALVNGVTIRQIAVETITYHHIELPSHAALLAEGVPAESYLASGNRSQFDNGGGAVALHPDFAQAFRAAAGFARFVETGKVVEAVRARLLARAAPVLTDEPALRLIDTPEGVTIVSRRFIPAEVAADPRDRRCLGVKIAALAIAGRAVALDHAALVAGWHEAEADGRWTDGAALIPRLLLEGASAASVTITLSGAGRYRIAA
ncbi:Hint domain-containing protein, partial [Acidiphilium sp.]|uniref:Hint domain-containing protein n=1 Tax=Acidiphilium sp. TaxID=527 RepID=UPI003D023633